ncbi:MAG TPA: alkanesulfonate monooxygenase, partial [Thermoanaerobaculia bacterium]
ALEVARALVAGAANDGEMERKFVKNTDSVTFRTRFEMAKDEWLSPVLWAGAVRTHGPASTALVGTPDEVAAAIDEYIEMGVTQFILSGWPKLEEMTYFSREVVPRVHAMRSVPCA